MKYYWKFQHIKRKGKMKVVVKQYFINYYNYQL